MILTYESPVFPGRFRPYKQCRPNGWLDEEMGVWNEECPDIINRLNLDLYGSAFFQKDCYEEAYDDHLRKVNRYFDGRDGDLLVLDITAGDNWDKLCSFLGKNLPHVAFPSENITQ